MITDYENLANYLRAHAFIGAVDGIIKRLDNSKKYGHKMTAEEAIEAIRAELHAFNQAEDSKVTGRRGA